MINQEMMQSMMWSVLGQQYDKLPEQAKQALSQLEIGIAKFPDKLIIRFRSDSRSESTDKAMSLLIDQLYQFLPEYLNKSFKVKVSLYGD